MEKGFYVGWGMSDITPPKTTGIYGQFHHRISKGILDPLTVTALAIESVDKSGLSEDYSIMVSCDLNDMPSFLQDAVRNKLKDELEEVASQNVFLMSTHIHTGPYLSRFGPYNDPDDRMFDFPDDVPGIMTPEAYCEFLIDKIIEAIKRAWNGRKKAGVSWQLGHATVGHNRRMIYDDGTAMMYGNSNSIHFRGPEGPEDSGIEMLYFFDEKETLTGILMNVACPAQVVESLEYITADYWGALRNKLWEKYGKEIFVFPMCGAAGDQSPRDLIRRGRGESDMFAMAGCDEIGNRLLRAFEYKWEDAKKSIIKTPILKHICKVVELPYKCVTKAEYEQTKACYDELIKKYGEGNKPYLSAEDYTLFEDFNALYECTGIFLNAKYRKRGPTYNAEVHIIRLGEIAIASNPFELFTTYGLMIKASSVAEQTFIAELACDDAGYLATEQAIQGGSYSVCVAAGLVGPEGGRLLTEQTVSLINALWKV